MGTGTNRQVNRKLETIAVLALLTVPVLETPKKMFPKWVEVNGKMECCWVEADNSSR